MRVVVPVKFVPDLVEELVIDESGVTLDSMELILCLNEFDDHAIEQAILLKERDGSQVTIIAPGLEEADNVLFNAAAKGADQLVRLAGDFDENMSSHAYARILTPIMRDLEPDLILTGVQAHNDLDGQLGALLAEYLKFPYVGYVASVKSVNGKAEVRKEYPGGLMVKLEVNLPAVFGIQVAEQPPRYVAFSRVRQAMKTTAIEERTAIDPDHTGAPDVSRLFQPVSSKRATMIEGEADVIAARLIAILTERSYLQRGQ
jgi:electron transfer flavoprotein beta subunit